MACAEFLLAGNGKAGGIVTVLLGFEGGRSFEA